MKTTIGTNMKATFAASTRAAVRKLYEGVLGADVLTPMPDLEVYRFEDRQIGAYFFDDAEALTRAQHRLSVWLEFAVADVDATSAALVEAGAERLPYADQEHPYFQGPGGLVFRLCAA